MDSNVTAVFRFALDLALKATILFSAAGLALLALRRRPASERHLVGAFALAAALLFPLLAPVLPRLDLPLLPTPVPERRTGSPRGAAPADLLPRRGAVSTESATLAEEGAPAEAPAPEDSEPVLAPIAAVVAPRPAETPARFELPLPAMAAAVGLWIAVGLALLARFLVGAARARQLRRRAVPILDPEWTALADSLGAALPPGAPVALFWSDRIPVAVTCGLRRPVLLLPESARSWDPPRRRVVLLHELAHVARRDWPVLLASEVALAVYWFHPLAWILARRLRRDAERAADDRVLAAGTKPSVYAGHLLGIIRSLVPGERRPLPVMGMARPSHFEERLRSILDPGLRRRPVAAWQARTAAAVFLVAAASLAVLQPWSVRCAEAALPTEFPDAETPAPAALAASVPAASRAPRAPSCSRSPAPARRPRPLPAALRSLVALSPAQAEPAPEARSPEVATPAPAALAMPVAAPERWSPGFAPASKHPSREGKDSYKRAWKLHEEERWSEASAAFASAYAAGYRKDASAYNAACGFARAGQPDRAFAWLEKAADEGFDVLASLSRDEDLESLRSDPRFSDLRNRLRQAQAATKREEAAELGDRFRRLAERFPEGAEELDGLGRELLDAGSYELAAQAFRLSARAGIQNGVSLYNAACAYALGGDRARALDFLNQALEAGFDDPKQLKSDEDLDALRSESRFRELVALADGLELRDVSDDGWKSAGTRQRSGWARAARDYETFANAHPDLGRAWFNLGFARLGAGEAAGAVEAFEKALARRYREPTTLYNLACANARLGRKDEAFGYLFQALHRGFGDRGQLRHDDDLETLRSDPRFREALKLAEKKTEREL